MKNRPDPTKAVNKVNSKLIKPHAKFPEFKVGDALRVYVRVKEGEKTRVQPFEGLVIKKRRGGVRSSFTVRKMASGVGVERSFSIFSPVIDRIMLISKGEVRRAKLYYLRGLKGRAGRIKSDYVYEDTDMTETAQMPENSQEKKSEKENADEANVSAKAAQA